MQRGTKAELQMLRELMWHFGDITECFFCGKPLLALPPDMTFGHRRHPPIDTKLTIHHDDRDRDNNTVDNRKPCHQSCHRSFHGRERSNAAAV